MALAAKTNASARYSISSWQDLEAQDAQSYLEQQILTTQRLTVVRCVYRPGSDFPLHFHPQEQITIVEDGELRFRVEQDEVRVKNGEMIAILPQVRHSTRAEGGARALNLFVRPASTHGH